MIINYSKKFTFIHCPKTAGSSIVVYLAPYLGPKDLQIGIWKASAKAGFPPNRRVYRDLLANGRLFSMMPRAILRRQPVVNTVEQVHRTLYIDRLGPQATHSQAKDIRALDTKAWDDHFKFCFVRNPFERIVSYYEFKERKREKKGLSRRSFRQFVEYLNTAGPDEMVVPDTWKQYTIDDKVAVDFVGRFEQLGEDMKVVCDRIGIPFDTASFPHANRGTSHRHREYYTPYERGIVENLCRRELEHFGYSF